MNTITEDTLNKIRYQLADILDNTLGYSCERPKLFPEYRGIEFWITDHRDETLYNEEYPFMYHLRDPKTGWEVASGAYRTKAEASSAALSRIENMTF